MNRRHLISYSLLFILVVLLQGLVFDKLNILSFINPQIYIIFILLLPFETPRWLELLSAFLLGITVGLFTNTSGIHAAACVLLAYARPYIANSLTSKREFEAGVKPGIKDLHFKWFFLYSFILISIHHSAYFLLEAFSFNYFMLSLRQIGATIVFSLGIIILSQYLLPRRLK